MNRLRNHRIPLLGTPGNRPDNPLYDLQTFSETLTKEYHEKPIVYVPRDEYDHYGAVAVKEAADKLGVAVIPTDTTPAKEWKLSPLYSVIQKPDNTQLYKRLESIPIPTVDTSEIPKGRYHDRIFPKDYYKKKKAKRRQQKQAKKKNR